MSISQQEESLGGGKRRRSSKNQAGDWRAHFMESWERHDLASLLVRRTRSGPLSTSPSASSK